MSLTTRCPSCGTMFKVVPDQLRISEGWVRCGHCADIFDASTHLLTPEDMEAQAAPRAADPEGEGGQAFAPAPQPVPEADDLPEAVAAPEADGPPQPAVWQRRSMAARTVLHGQAPDAPLEPGEPEDEEEDQDEARDAREVPDDLGTGPSRHTLEDRAPRNGPADLRAEPEPHAAPRPVDATDGPYFHEDDDLPPLPTLTEDVPSALLLQTADSDETQDLLYQSAFAVPAAPPAGSAEAGIDAAEDAAAAALAPELRELGFVRAAERRAFWRRPLVVAASFAVCLLLGLALLLQVAVAERDRIAASLPGLRPALQALCAPLHCQVSPLKRIDALVIDGSAFNKARGELYQLNVDLRSTAGVPLAMPSLELTLTDTDDKTLLRRVLSPAELHAPLVLPARGAWSGTLPVRLAEPADAARVAGYRVLAFYP